MNKRIIVAALLFSANLAPSALACKANQISQLSQAQVQTALVGSNLVSCFPTGGPPWTNQETLSGGIITDFKKGPPAPGNTDPTAAVGNYIVGNDGSVSNGVITYAYGGGTSPSSFYVVLVAGGTIGGAATYTFYGPGANGAQGPCPTYGNVAVKVAQHC
jgi:hypothetical protein